MGSKSLHSKCVGFILSSGFWFSPTDKGELSHFPPYLTVCYKNITFLPLKPIKAGKWWAQQNHRNTSTWMKSALHCSRLQNRSSLLCTPGGSLFLLRSMGNGFCKLAVCFLRLIFCSECGLSSGALWMLEASPVWDKWCTMLVHWNIRVQTCLKDHSMHMTARRKSIYASVFCSSVIHLSITRYRNCASLGEISASTIKPPKHRRCTLGSFYFPSYLWAPWRLWAGLRSQMLDKSLYFGLGY